MVFDSEDIDEECVAGCGAGDGDRAGQGVALELHRADAGDGRLRREVAVGRVSALELDDRAGFDGQHRVASRVPVPVDVGVPVVEAVVRRGCRRWHTRRSARPKIMALLNPSVTGTNGVLQTENVSTTMDDSDSQRWPRQHRLVFTSASPTLRAAITIPMAELDSEGNLTRSKVAAFLREFADEIDDGTSERHHGREERQEGFSDEDPERRHDQEERREEFSDDDSVDPKRVTLIVGGDSATVTVPDTVDFDVEVESRSPMFGSGVHQGIEFELSWEIEDPDQLSDDGIDVE